MLEIVLLSLAIHIDQKEKVKPRVGSLGIFHAGASVRQILVGLALMVIHMPKVGSKKLSQPDVPTQKKCSECIPCDG